MFTGDGPAAARAAAAAVGIAEDSTHWSLLPEDKLALVGTALFISLTSNYPAWPQQTMRQSWHTSAGVSGLPEGFGLAGSGIKRLSTTSRTPN